MAQKRIIPNWEASKADRQGSWITIEHDDFVLVCPTTDIRPHNLESITCDCGVSVEIGEKGELYGKPMYIHNRHEDNDMLEEAMKQYD